MSGFSIRSVIRRYCWPVVIVVLLRERPEMLVGGGGGGGGGVWCEVVDVTAERTVWRDWCVATVADCTPLYTTVHHCTTLYTTVLYTTIQPRPVSADVPAASPAQWVCPVREILVRSPDCLFSPLQRSDRPALWCPKSPCQSRWWRWSHSGGCSVWWWLVVAVLYIDCGGGCVVSEISAQSCQPGRAQHNTVTPRLQISFSTVSSQLQSGPVRGSERQWGPVRSSEVQWP